MQHWSELAPWFDYIFIYIYIWIIWIKGCSRNRTDDAMFKVAESLLSNFVEQNVDIRIFTKFGQTCQITVYPLACQHCVQSGCTPPFAKAAQTIQLSTANILLCPRVDLIVQWVPEMIWGIKMHKTDFLWWRSRRRDSSPNRCEISMEDFIAESSPAEQLVLLMFEFLSFLDS